MEKLARNSGNEELRNKLFICNVFSLLNKIMNKPFTDLLKTIPIPMCVQQALIDNNGPYVPYCDLMRTIKTESLFDIRETTNKLLINTAEINHATLRALAHTNQLE